MKELFRNLYGKSKNEYFIKLSKYLDNHEKKFVVTANPETFRIAQEDDEVRSILLNGDNDIIPDGIAVVKAAKRFGYGINERITGFDTALKLLELVNNKKKTLYLFGAKPDVLEKLLEVIKVQYASEKPNVS